MNTLFPGAGAFLCASDSLHLLRITGCGTLLFMGSTCSLGVSLVCLGCAISMNSSDTSSSKLNMSSLSGEIEELLSIVGRATSTLGRSSPFTDTALLFFRTVLVSVISGDFGAAVDIRRLFLCSACGCCGVVSIGAGLLWCLNGMRSSSASCCCSFGVSTALLFLRGVSPFL